ncbi:MAG TPA: hypothetical protein VF174_08165 [Micromonosporaceae bacterium]
MASTRPVSTTTDRKRGIDWLGWAALAIGLAGLGFRGWLTALDVPPTNSDEATFGLVALHVLRGTDFPVYLYGQHYMGTLESYVAAPLMAFVGPTTYALRTGTLLFYGLFLITMYAMTRRVYSPGLALLTVAVLALGSDRVVNDQLVADGSAELALFAALLILLAVAVGSAQARRRPILLGLWGAVAGLALWDHLLVIPYLAATVPVLVLALIRGQPGGGAGPARTGLKDVLVTTVGLTLGATPMLIYQLDAPAGADPLSVLIQQSSAGPDATWPDRLYGAIFLGVPLATGVCEPGVCQPWQTLWGPIYIGLLLVSGYLSWRTIRDPGGWREDEDTSEALRIHRIRAMAGLALVLGALATIASYAKSPTAGDTPLESARYLSLLPVSAPAVLWPLWQAVRMRGNALRLPATVGAAALLVSMSWATVSLVRQVPAQAQQAEQQRELLAALDRLDVRHYYTEYWTCNLLAYASGERAVCFVLGDDLKPGLNRYRPYEQMVKSAQEIAYVTPAGSDFDRNVRRYLSSAEGTLRMTEAAGYRIYLSTTHPLVN